MNDERDITEMQRLVSETYHSAATEQAPKHLNEKVLRMAAGEPATRQQRFGHSGAASWLRPAAWAATISLSLAIVLEITRDPAPQIAQTVVSTEAPTADAVAGHLEEAIVEVNAPAEKPRLNKMQAPAALSAERETENMARQRTDPKLQNKTLGIAAMAAPAEKKEFDAAHECDSETRKTADSWFACIRILRATGLTAEAESEYDEFVLQFPDFAPN